MTNQIKITQTLLIIGIPIGAYTVTGQGMDALGNVWEVRRYVAWPPGLGNCYMYWNVDGSTYQVFPNGIRDHTPPEGVGGWFEIGGVIFPK